MRARFLFVFVAVTFLSHNSLAQTLTTLADFAGTTSTPIGSLVRGNDGNFYGVTYSGGVGYGSVFKISPSGVFTSLYTFCGNTSTCSTDGIYPSAGLIQASDGNFYGTTSLGGAKNEGTIFRISPTGAYSILYSFCSGGGDSCVDGAQPYASLVQGSDGNLYGTTFAGGNVIVDGENSNSGTIFKITLGGSFTSLYSFCSMTACADGQHSRTNLISGSDGALYGTTLYGGTTGPGKAILGGGTIFRITDSGSFSVVYRFCSLTACADGITPNSPLTQGRDGAFYGTTSAKVGIFKVTAGGSFTPISETCSQSYMCPTQLQGSLLLGSDGNLYGTSTNGGSNGDGTVYKITSAGIYATVYSFCTNVDFQGDCLDGESPTTGLIEGSGGALYGYTTEGGTAGNGIFFSLSIPGLSGGSGSTSKDQGDYLGEGKAGFTVWRPSTGYWYSIDGAGGSAARQWGAPTDLPVIGDFDGDGKSDFAVFRPSTGYWYIAQSSNGDVVAKQWGASTDTPVAGDFDGDGKTDIAVFRPSTGYWYVVQSSNGEVLVQQWGASSDTPVVGDFDGDGKSDVAVYRPSNGYWYITQSSNGAVVSRQWGAPTDIPVTGDFDGDGKTDIAVYRPSTGYWYIIQSGNGQVVSKQWGAAGDVPVARDYDGDGKTDIGVWRPSTGYWYVIKSTTGQTQAQQWGAATDIPVNSLTH